MLAELAQEAGVPDGVLQIIHGAAPTVNALLDAPEVKALSFVGGDKAGTYVHQRGTHQGKRVQSNMQAKNHCVSTVPSVCTINELTCRSSYLMPTEMMRWMGSWELSPVRPVNDVWPFLPVSFVCHSESFDS
jgi:hypothetical protein